MLAKALEGLCRMSRSYLEAAHIAALCAARSGAAQGMLWEVQESQLMGLLLVLTPFLAPCWLALMKPHLQYRRTCLGSHVVRSTNCACY